MHFSDDDLAAALRRKDPGPEFTQKILAAIEQQKLGARQPLLDDRRFRGWWPFRFSPIWAWGGAVAALVLAIGTGVGIEQYRDHQEKIAQAEKAREEAILALRITNAKLNHVFRRVDQQEAPQPKLRRQTL